METQKNQISLFQVSEIEVSYRPKFKASERPIIDSSKSAYEILLNNWNMNLLELQEQFKIILLSTSNKVIGIYEASTGSIAGTIVDPKLVFATALKACATSIILTHNHPSGNLKPSPEDIKLTNKIKEGGKLLDIRVLDHLIVTAEGYYSFADEGLM